MIDFSSFQSVTHPVFVFRPSSLNVGVSIHNRDESRNGMTGPISVSGQVVGGALPPGWTPTAAAMSVMATPEPWVLMPMSALEQHFSRKQEWGTPAGLSGQPVEPGRRPLPLSGLRPTRPEDLVLSDRAQPSRMLEAAKNTVEPIDGEIQPE